MSAEKPRELYNKETGGRLDLDVFDEPEAVAATRWRNARIAYLATLLAGDISDRSRGFYQGEIDRLQKDRKTVHIGP
jgi:hypothetical protein